MSVLCAVPHLELMTIALVSKFQTARKLGGGAVKKYPETSTKENIFISEEHNIFSKICICFV